MERVRRYFGIDQAGTTVSTEVRAGFATFLTMAYVLAVNPQVLSQAGLPARDVVFATAVGSAVATLLMALYARLPFALAPGMGLNAWFTFGVVLGMGVDWRTALTAVLVEGVLFLALSFGGIRSALLHAIPATVQAATTVGIGLFLALIGFKNAGLVVGHPATLVALGDLATPGLWLALAALVLIAALMARGVKGALLIGIGVATGVAWLLGLSPPPNGVLAVPSLPQETLLAFNFGALATPDFWLIVLAFLFVDLFDTAGVLLGVSRVGGMLDAQGRVPRATPAFVSDALGTITGAMLGTSTITTYLESAAGVREGGRTGLTAAVVAVLFLLSLLFMPLLVAVPALATAPALIAVGAAMLSAAGDLDLRHFDEALPAFLTVALMPFTFSIANGIAAGIVSWVVLKVITGKWRQVRPLAAVLAALLTAWYGLR